MGLYDGSTWPIRVLYGYYSILEALCQGILLYLRSYFSIKALIDHYKERRSKIRLLDHRNLKPGAATSHGTVPQSVTTITNENTLS